VRLWDGLEELEADYAIEAVSAPGLTAPGPGGPQTSERGQAIGMHRPVGRRAFLLSGGKDLLDLRNEDIPIITPGEFVAGLHQAGSQPSRKCRGWH
jgi:hypothetical protein